MASIVRLPANRSVCIPTRMERIASRDDIERGLDWLAAKDPVLAHVRERVEAVAPVPLRLDEPGFVPLIEIICTQQISRASAAAIFARLRERVVPLDPQGILDLDDAAMREIGLSRPKLATMRAVSHATIAGTLNLVAVCSLDAEQATAHLCAVPGIGPWTAGVYLLFCAGHSDILPTGDVALQWSASEAFRRNTRMSARELDDLAESWSPWRGVAARLLWAHYAVIKGREVIP